MSGSLLVALMFAVSVGLPGAASDICGNGRVDAAAGEMCDDGNAVDGDGCSKTCSIECGFNCDSLWMSIPGAGVLGEYGFFNSICVADHGDGKRRLGEQCDDGNLLSGDGCDCTAATNTAPGRCVQEKNWDCTAVAEIGIACASRLPMGDACECTTYLGTVKHPAQPLNRVPERSETVQSGYAGASRHVRCAACACDHYGNCQTGSYCNWATTCSGNGFCDGDGNCICFGNFTGDNCNRCKCDHYGDACQTYCHPNTTCGGHGYCDFDGACKRSPMCARTCERADR